MESCHKLTLRVIKLNVALFLSNTYKQGTNNIAIVLKHAHHVVEAIGAEESSLRTIVVAIQSQ